MKKNMNQNKRNSKSNGGGRKANRTKKSMNEQDVDKFVHTLRKVTATDVSPCARKYAQCLANPMTGPLACVPGLYPNSTLQSRVFAKGQFYTGANGLGGIAFDPQQSAANNRLCIVKTKQTSTISNFSIDNAVEWDNIASNSTYPEAQLGSGGNQAAFRVVGAVLRIKYAGTQFERGGTIYGLHDPTHETLFGRSISDLLGEVQAKTMRISEDWVALNYYPVQNSDYVLGTGPFYTQGLLNDLNSDRFYMGFLIQVPNGVGPQPFDFEAYTVLEYQGRIVRGQKPTQADPVGLAKVTTLAVTNNSPLHPSSLSLEQRAAAMGIGLENYTHEEQGFDYKPLLAKGSNFAQRLLSEHIPTLFEQLLEI